MVQVLSVIMYLYPHSLVTDLKLLFVPFLGALSSLAVDLVVPSLLPCIEDWKGALTFTGGK